MKKLKGMGSVSGALSHCFRTRETANADASKTHENEHMRAKSAQQALAMTREHLQSAAESTGRKIRSDAVLMLEYVCTASPEAFAGAWEEEKEAFFAASLQFLEEKFGAENVVVASVHNDETTQHLSAFVVPRLAAGGLSAKSYTSKIQLRQDQTRFHELVSTACPALQLQRGIEGSKAKHQTIQKYYSKLNDAADTEKATKTISAESPIFERKKTGLLKKETDEEYTQRIVKAINTHKIEPLQKLAGKLVSAEDKLKNAERTALYAEEAERKKYEREREDFAVTQARLAAAEREIFTLKSEIEKRDIKQDHRRFLTAEQLANFEKKELAQAEENQDKMPEHVLRSIINDKTLTLDKYTAQKQAAEQQQEQQKQPEPQQQQTSAPSPSRKKSGPSM